MQHSTRTNRFSRSLLWGAAGALLVTATTQTLSAQDVVRTASRTRYVDDLVRRLMDSETDRKAVFEATQPDPTRNLTPGARLTSPTREMLEARKLLADFAKESSTLTLALDDERNKLPAVRPYFSDVLKIRASSYLLVQRASGQNNHRDLIRDFARIDQDFRLLSYNLRQIRGLSRTVAQPVVRMEKLDKSLSTLLSVAPQIDRGTLIQKTATLGSGLQHLLDDIEIELERSTDRNQLLIDGRRIHQQVSHVSSTISEQASRATVLAEYQRFLTAWTSFEARLRPHQNRYIERSLRRIDTVNHDIKELLWIPHEVDRTELLHQTDTLKRNVDSFFERAPLKLLITLKDTSNVLPVSDEFYGMCEHFADCVEEKQTHDELVEAFRFVETSWTEFHATFDPLQSQKAHLVLQDIESGIRSLREELKIEDSFDRKAAIELAAAVDNLAQHLTADVNRWIGNNDTELGRQARKDTAAFSSAARQLHTDAVGGSNVAKLTQDCESLFNQWGNLHSYIPRADKEDLEHLQRVSSRMTPYLVDLRTMLAAYQ